MNKSLEEKIAEILIEKNLTITTVESCTGGLIASRLTDVSGSSAYLKQSFVTYSNEAKIKYAFVNPTTLEKYSAVSKQTVIEMATKILKNTDADVAISISGLAGPNSDESGKPVGLVYVCVANAQKFKVGKFNLSYRERKQMKFDFSEMALKLLFEFLGNLV